MKTINPCLILTAALLLGGCASHKPVWSTATNDQSIEPPAKVAQASKEQMQSGLAKAAASASSSLKKLAAINVYEQTKKAKLPFVNIHDEALESLMPDVSFYGPALALLRTVAKNTGYQLQVYGKKPATPILVQVIDDNQAITAKQIITDIALQAGKNADIMILPKQKIISLRYLVR